MTADHWFATARFGLFVHWGMFSLRGYEPSWPLVGGNPAFPYGQDVTVADYYRDADLFVPPEGSPREWVRLAKAAGMTYAVLTTKHHDGYTLFPSTHSSLGIQRSAPGRDLVREFVDATRAEGLRVGLYYSLPDWSHPDYPAFTDAMRPYSLSYPRAEPEAWARYLAVLCGQLDELLTGYGTIDLLWFDGGWERSADEWGSTELESFIRSRQPDIVINDRLPGVGDYQSPEQAVPLDPLSGWWETCMTMNHSWGPVVEDQEHKSTRFLLSVLTDVANGGGNLLLNVSPDGQGVLPPWQRTRLEEIGAWMARHGEAIVGTEPGLAPGRFYGPTTRRGSTTYLFCTMRPQQIVTVRGLRGKHIVAVRALGTDRALTFERQLSAIDRIFGGDSVGDVVITVPDDACDDLITVLEITTDA